MTFKNLCKDRELTGDLLRQRRDFYAISLGLILFHLAGGGMRDSATLSAMPVKLLHPAVLYWSAWVSFVYFAWRFWVLDPGSVTRFRQEWNRQARATGAFHRLCLEWMKECVGGKAQTEEIRSLLSHARPPFPHIAEGAHVDFHEFESLQEGGHHFIKQVSSVTVKRKDLWRLRVARAFGFLRAIFLERTASDLLLPYVLGGAAIICAAVTIAAGHTPWRID